MSNKTLAFVINKTLAFIGTQSEVSSRDTLRNCILLIKCALSK
jgi:hypothetical protein